MKYITLLILVVLSTPLNAKLYKCVINGKTAYQAIPCKGNGHEFSLKKDISKEQQKAAVKNLNSDLQAMHERDRQAKIAHDNERLIRAEENKANANYANARQSARQANAIYQRNQLEALKKLY